MENELKKYGLILWHWAWLIVLGTAGRQHRLHLQSLDDAGVFGLDHSAGERSAEQRQDGRLHFDFDERRLARTYSEMMTKQPVLEAALEDLNLELSGRKLARAYQRESGARYAV